MKQRKKIHIDDMLTVTLTIEFDGKLNPKAKDPRELDEIKTSTFTFAAPEMAEYLEEVLKAIRERRLYGWMMQDSAQCAVECDEWIERTPQEKHGLPPGVIGFSRKAE